VDPAQPKVDRLPGTNCSWRHAPRSPTTLLTEKLIFRVHRRAERLGTGAPLARKASALVRNPRCAGARRHGCRPATRRVPRRRSESSEPTNTLSVRYRAWMAARATVAGRELRTDQGRQAQSLWSDVSGIFSERSSSTLPVLGRLTQVPAPSAGTSFPSTILRLDSAVERPPVPAVPSRAQR